MSVYVWLVLAVVAAVLEVFSSSFITLWFVIGALIAFVCSFFGVPWEIQAIVFVVVSLACLFALRPFALKHANIGESKEPSPVGETAHVVEEIPVDGFGRVELSNHMTWSAKSANGDKLECGTKVVIVKQESAKLVVERM